MNRTQKVLAVAIVVVAALHFVGVNDHRVRNFEVLPEMLTSIPYDAQAENENFPDGKTIQPPVPGTIARGFLPLSSRGLLLDTTREWKQLPAAQQDAWNALAAPAVPEQRSAAELSRGREVFQAICATCHGAGGAGDGPVTKRGVPPPPSLLLPGSAEKSDGHMFRIITVGQGNMAAHAAQVTRVDRWRAIRYVRTLQKR